MRRPRLQNPRSTPFAVSVEQRTNALINSARSASQRSKAPRPDIDWDACIARLRAMLDNLEAG